VRVRQAGREAEAEAMRETFRRRFCDLSSFVKALKERFSRWLNKRHARRGTLWMDRFKSVLVEDPKDYRWTGYGEAAAVGAAASSGELVQRRGCDRREGLGGRSVPRVP
jgi:hypothetical protein